VKDLKKKDKGNCWERGIMSQWKFSECGVRLQKHEFKLSSSHIYPARESLLFRRLTGLNSASLHAGFASEDQLSDKQNLSQKHFVALLFGCFGGCFGPLLPRCCASLARSGMRQNQIYNKQSSGSDKAPFPYRCLSFHAERGMLFNWLLLSLRLVRSSLSKYW
jgi:hypothetical protein